MKEHSKKTKGDLGYLKYAKTKKTLHLVLLIAAGIGIFILGLALNKWEARNVFTILAILMVLPAARVFVSLVILLPYKPVGEEVKNKVEALKRENDELFFNVVFTSSEHVMHLDALLVTEHQAVGLFTDSNGKAAKNDNNSTADKKDKAKIIEEYFKKEFSARHIDFIYYQANGLGSFEARLNRRSDSEMITQKQAADRKEVLEMIKTAIV